MDLAKMECSLICWDAKTYTVTPRLQDAWEVVASKKILVLGAQRYSWGYLSSTMRAMSGLGSVLFLNKIF